MAEQGQVGEERLCAECQHWDTGTPDPAVYGHNFHPCMSRVIKRARKNNWTPAEVSLDGAIIDHAEGPPWLFTGPQFGCVHWAMRQPQESTPRPRNFPLSLQG